MKSREVRKAYEIGYITGKIGVLYLFSVINQVDQHL